MSKYKETKLGDLIGIKHGYAFKGKDIIDTDNGIVLVTPGNFDFGGGFKDTGKKFFKGEIPEEFILKSNDLIVTMTDLSKNADTLGYSALIPSDENIYLHNQRIGLIDIKSDLIYEDYLYWVLRTPWYQRRIANTSTGVNVKHTSPRKIYEYKFSLPDLETQEKIADILSTYDRLIENNNRRIEILEKTSEEIYKEWFVRMRFPGHENTKFIKGIPEGWEVRKLNEIFDIADGTHDTPKKVSIGIPLVTGKNIVNGSIDFDSTYNISIEDFEKINVRSAIYKNDILYSNIGTIGTMAIVNDDNKYSVKNLIILKTNEYKFYEYIYLLFKNKSSQDFFESVASGASQKFISLAEMRKHKILLPCSKLLLKFKANIKDIFEEIKIVEEQNQNLIKQRDLLLPRLMNGTIQVK